MKRITWMIMLLLLTVGAALAQDDQGQPNDPRMNPRANACFEGGTLEGQCHGTDADRDGDVDREDINFMWRCGWYIIRAQQGILQPGQYPAECYTRPVRALVPELICPDAAVGAFSDFGEFFTVLDDILFSRLGDVPSEEVFFLIEERLVITEGEGSLQFSGDVDDDGCLDLDLTLIVSDFGLEPRD